MPSDKRKSKASSPFHSQCGQKLKFRNTPWEGSRTWFTTHTSGESVKRTAGALGGVHARASSRSILLRELCRQEESQLLSIVLRSASPAARFLHGLGYFTFRVSKVAKNTPAVLAKQRWRQPVNDGLLAQTNRVGDASRHPQSGML